jgi:hypothetical protein
MKSGSELHHGLLLTAFCCRCRFGLSQRSNQAGSARHSQLVGFQAIRGAGSYSALHEAQALDGRVIRMNGDRGLEAYSATHWLAFSTNTDLGSLSSSFQKRLSYHKGHSIQ